MVLLTAKFWAYDHHSCVSMPETKTGKKKKGFLVVSRIILVLEVKGVKCHFKPKNTLYCHIRYFFIHIINNENTNFRYLSRFSRVFIFEMTSLLLFLTFIKEPPHHKQKQRFYLNLRCPPKDTVYKLLEQKNMKKTVGNFPLRDTKKSKPEQTKFKHAN